MRTFLLFCLLIIISSCASRVIVKNVRFLEITDDSLIFMKDGSKISSDTVSIWEDTLFYAKNSSYNSLPVSKIDKIITKDKVKGGAHGFLWGTTVITGFYFALGIQGLIKDEDDSFSSLYFVFAPIAGVIAGLGFGTAGLITGYFTYYEFQDSEHLSPHDKEELNEMP